MTDRTPRDWQVEDQLEHTRHVLRRSHELIDQSDRLLKQCQQLMRDFGFLPQRHTPEEQPPPPSK